MIDTEDLPKVDLFPGAWGVLKDRSTGDYYARGRGDVLMHRLIMDAPKGLVVDHIHHNTLDNRKSQMRVTTRTNNRRNLKGASRNSSSGIIGVYWRKFHGRWGAQIRVDGKNIHLGYYDDKYEAGRVATEARLRYFGSTFVDRKPIIIE